MLEPFWYLNWLFRGDCGLFTLNDGLSGGTSGASSFVAYSGVVVHNTTV